MNPLSKKERQKLYTKKFYSSAKPCRCSRPGYRRSRGEWVCEHCYHIERWLDNRRANAQLHPEVGLPEHVLHLPGELA